MHIRSPDIIINRSVISDVRNTFPDATSVISSVCMHNISLSFIVKAYHVIEIHCVKSGCTWHALAWLFCHNLKEKLTVSYLTSRKPRRPYRHKHNSLDQQGKFRFAVCVTRDFMQLKIKMKLNERDGRN